MAGLTRRIYRGWTRGESFWDAQGMNENLQFISDHLPIYIKYPTGPRPNAGTSEGDTWINKRTGQYSVWSTPIDGGQPAWNDYSPLKGLTGFDSVNGELLVNTGNIWDTLYYTDKFLIGFEAYDSATNMLKLRMNDGEIIEVNMSDLINDAIETMPYATTTVAGKVMLAEDSDTSSSDLAVTPSGLGTQLNNLRDSHGNLTSGTNTSLSGVGSVSDPYAVNVAEASTTVKGVIQIAQDTDTVSTTKAVTPAMLKAATDAVLESSGHLENGTNTTVAGDGSSTNPYTVSVQNASTTVKGVIQIAATNDTTSTDKALTPAALTAQLAAIPETKVTAGTNVTVTGTGTQTDPYVVSSLGGGGGTDLYFQSGSGTVLSGAGTTSDKYKYDLAQATTSSIGGVTLNDGTQATDTDKVLTASSFNTLVSNATPNAVQESVVTGLSYNANFTQLVKDRETTTTLLAVPAFKSYTYTNEDGATTALTAANFLSADSGQSLDVGTDGGMFVNVIGLLPPDNSYSGTNNNKIDISFDQDITDPTLYTVGAELSVATQTPNAEQNALTWSSVVGGYYIHEASTTQRGAVELAAAGDTTSTDKAVTPAVMQSEISSQVTAATPDTSATVRGLVNLVDSQSLGAGRKNIDGVTIGRGNPAHAGRGTVTAIGENAANNNTGSDVSAIGYNAAFYNTAYGETAIGARAGTFNTGTSSVHIGVYAGNKNTGAYHSAIGFGAGQYNTGNEVSVTGYGAGALNTGADLTASGAFAGRMNIGERVTLLGKNSGYYNQGNDVTAVGSNAGNAATGTTHSIVTTSTGTGTISPAVPAGNVGKTFQITVTSPVTSIFVKFTSTTAFNIVDASGLAAGSYSGTLFTGVSFNNVTLLGANAQATKSNQVVLGDGNVTEVLTAGNHVADNYIGRVNTSGTIDVGTAQLFARTVSGATTFAFTGSVTGQVHSFVLELTNAGSAVVTWPTAVKWEGGTAPTLTAAGVDILGFYTRDGGVTWRGMVLAKDSK